MLFCSLINPLPTDDDFWRRQILATCYQLAQSVLKIGSALAGREGQGRDDIIVKVNLQSLIPASFSH